MCVGEEVVLEIDLMPSAVLNGKGNKIIQGKPENPIGRLLLYCTVRDEKDVMEPIYASNEITGAGMGLSGVEVTNQTIDDFVHEGFVHGVLTLKAAQSFKLPNREFTGKGDPFLVFQLGPWKARSKTLKGAGGDCVWGDLELSTEVAAEDLRAHTLTVCVYDENTHRDNVLICTGQILLKLPGSRIGLAVDVNIPLVDKNGKSAGRLVVTAQVRLIQIYTTFSLVYALLWTERYIT